MATLRVYQAYARIIPKSEQINLRVYSIMVEKAQRPTLRVHDVTVGAVIYTVLVRRAQQWVGVQTFVRRGQTWR